MECECSVKGYSNYSSFGRNGRTYKRCRSSCTNKKSNKTWKVHNHRALRREWRDYFHQEDLNDPCEFYPVKRFGDIWSSPKDSDGHSGSSLSRVQIEKRGFISDPSILEETQYISSLKRGSRKLSYNFAQYKQLVRAIEEKDVDKIQMTCME